MAGFPDLGFPVRRVPRYAGEQPPWVMVKRWIYSNDEDNQTGIDRYDPSTRDRDGISRIVESPPEIPSRTLTSTWLECADVPQAPSAQGVRACRRRAASRSPAIDLVWSTAFSGASLARLSRCDDLLRRPVHAGRDLRRWRWRPAPGTAARSSAGQVECWGNNSLWTAGHRQHPKPWRRRERRSPLIRAVDGAVADRTGHDRDSDRRKAHLRAGSQARSPTVAARLLGGQHLRAARSRGRSRARRASRAMPSMSFLSTAPPHRRRYHRRPLPHLRDSG